MFSSIYNCFAFVIRSILNCADTQLYLSYLCISPSKSETLNIILTKWFPEIFESGNISRILTPYFFDRKNVISKIYIFVNECIQSNSVSLLIRLASKLDTAMADCISDYTTDEEIYGLNSNSKEQQVQLLPRCHCKWAHKNKDKNCSIDLNNFLEHFYYVDTKALYEKTHCSVSHVFLESSTFSRAEERGYLSIGISALSDQIELDSILADDHERCSFIVNSISNVDLLVKNALSIQKKAMQEGVDILCFPEMLGHPKVNRALKEKLADYPEDDLLDYSALTICPTYWNDHTNKAEVINKFGEQVIAQAKQIPYPLPSQGKQYIEDIRPDHHIHLIHCEGIGRMAVIICKDAIDRDYLFNLINELKVTLLFVPSFSTGFYDFQENLSLCRAFDCTAVWINCCSVCLMTGKEKLEKIGTILKTGRRSQFKNGYYHFTHKNCTKENAGGCHNCLYIQHICFNSQI